MGVKNKKMDKKGAINIKGLVQGVLLVIIGIVLVSNFLAEGTPLVQAAGDDVNATEAPLSTLFASDSILPMVFLGAGFLAVIGLAFTLMGK